MALIGALSPKTIAKPKPHDAVDAAYCAFTVSGRRYLQLETVGRRTRENPGKTSQTMQLDAASAAALLTLIRSEFGL